MVRTGTGTRTRTKAGALKLLSLDPNGAGGRGWPAPTGQAGPGLARRSRRRSRVRVPQGRQSRPRKNRDIRDIPLLHPNIYRIVLFVAGNKETKGSGTFYGRWRGSKETKGKQRGQEPFMGGGVVPRKQRGQEHFMAGGMVPGVAERGAMFLRAAGESLRLAKSVGSPLSRRGGLFGVRRALAAFTRREATTNTANHPPSPPCRTPRARHFYAAITA
jgi:hypothetical protein